MGNDYGTRGILAGIKFLKGKGYKIVDKLVDRNIDIVALNGHTLHFVQVNVNGTAANGDSFNDAAEHKDMRLVLEKSGLMWLVDNYEYTDYSISFDVIDLVVVNEDRAVLRYHINVLADA